MKAKANRLFHACFAILSTLTVIVVGGFLVAIFFGYRPVVILTGSMGETAPPGSLVIAAPKPAAEVNEGDVLIMRREGKATVTHRVLEVEDNGRLRFAVTKGDANEDIDAVPYPLVYGKTELVMLWAQPGWGKLLIRIFQPGMAMVVLASVIMIFTGQALRWIWRNTHPKPLELELAFVDGTPPAGFRTRETAGRLASSPLLPLLTVGIAWALFGSSAEMLANSFSEVGCADPHLASVQHGTTTHSIDGTVTVPIDEVNTDRSFVLATVRSQAPSPSNSTVQAVLTSGGDTLQLFRNSEASPPPDIAVDWSVVEYACGVLVQRGVAPGTGTDTVSIPISAVNPGASFALVSTAAPSSDTSFDGDDMYRTSIDTGALTIESGGPKLKADRSFAWQIVSYGNPDDASIQTTDVVLEDGATSILASLETPVDIDSTVVLAEATSSFSGDHLNSRLVQARVVDGSTIEITRSDASEGRAVNVRVRTITFDEGTTVRHGVTDFAPGQTQKTVTVDHFDPSRTTAISTVMTPGHFSGGRTTHSADTTVGEASATFTTESSSSIIVRRDVATSGVSFAWQVIEWAGPQWWDTAYLYRQRVEVETDTAPAPQGYAVPVTIDHAALVTAGVSRSDGRDIRLLHWNGETWLELDRILQDGSNWNEVDTTILFKTISAINANDAADYWLYYGNNSPAAPMEDEAQVHVQEDGFELGETGTPEERGSVSQWYAADPWSHRIPLTVAPDMVASDQTDFPVLVSISHKTLANQAQADGSDIRFVGADGTTHLDHEIEKWLPNSGTLVAWVRLPNLAVTGTSFYVLVGSDNAPDQQKALTTWDPSVRAVWHMDRNPVGEAPQLDDSSITNIDGLSDGSMASFNLVSARIGDGISFDGTDDRLVGRNLGVGNRGALSGSAWIKPDSVSTSSVVLAQAGETANIEIGVAAGGEARVTISVSGAGLVTISGGNIRPGAWSHIAFSWDGNQLILYVNGVWASQLDVTGVLTVSSDPVSIGATADGASAFDGVVDEVRVETKARSADWFKAAVDNVSRSKRFVTVGEVETGTWFAMGAWQYRKPVVIGGAQITRDATDITLPLIITDADIQAEARPSGADIVVTAEDGLTRLDHVIESWDPATGSLKAWVKAPSAIAGTDLNMYLYYGNASANDQQDPAGTFGEDAQPVQVDNP